MNILKTHYNEADQLPQLQPVETGGADDLLLLQTGQLQTVETGPASNTGRNEVRVPGDYDWLLGTPVTGNLLEGIDQVDREQGGLEIDNQDNYWRGVSLNFSC